MATRARSPNYPAFSLQKALEYARKVYAVEPDESVHLLREMAAANGY